MTGSPPPLPDDDVLPSASSLLDVRRAGALLPDHLDGPGIVPDSLRVRYLTYNPGHRLVVQYDVRIDDGDRVDVVAVADRDGEVRSFRYPDDPALPCLASPTTAARALGLADVAPQRLAWVPMTRATLRVGDAVVKHYTDRPAAAAAQRAIAAVDTIVPTAPALAVDLDRHLVAQQRLDGMVLARHDAAGRAADAAGLVAALQRVPVDALAALDPAAMLAQATAPAALAGFALVDVAERLHRALDALRATAPQPDRLIAAHGDFNVGQLLDCGGRLFVVDVDTLCAAPMAFDVAAYATNVISGRVDDLAEARRVLDALVAHWGGPLPDLDWYVAVTAARRVDRAVRRLKRDWPQRTRRLVDALEQLVAVAVRSAELG